MVGNSAASRLAHLYPNWRFWAARGLDQAESEVGHLLEAGHAAWRVTAHHGPDCLTGLGGERPRTVEETDQSVHA
jgi:hypothetical protein